MSQAMNPKRDPAAEKAAVLKKVETRLGPTEPESPRRPDWRISENGSTSVFITFSKDEQLFYDVNGSDLEKWAKYACSFVVFVLGSADNALVLPLPVLRDSIVKTMTSGERGNYKLHIIGTSRLRFSEAPDVDLDGYRNAYELIRE
jgi:hypothetical protein